MGVLEQEEQAMQNNLTADAKKQAVAEAVEQKLIDGGLGLVLEKAAREQITKVVGETIEQITGKQKEIEMALSQPREVTVKGTPKVEVEFPDEQKVSGEVKIVNIVKAIISNLPPIQKITGKVIAKIEGTVDARVEFPDVQRVQFEADQKVTVANPLDPADLETRLTTAFKAALPVARGYNPKKETANPTFYLPVRLTNGKAFYDLMTSVVQGNGKLNALLERLLVQTNKNVSSWTALARNVASAGTGEQLAGLAVPDGMALLIKAKETNTGLIYLGNTKAASENAASRFTLTAGAYRTLRITNANLVWINSSVSSEGIEYSVEQAT